MTKAKRERKEKAKAEAHKKREDDRVRHEREAFARNIAAAHREAKTTAADGIVDDDEGRSVFGRESPSSPRPRQDRRPRPT